MCIRDRAPADRQPAGDASARRASASSGTTDVDADVDALGNPSPAPSAGGGEPRGRQRAQGAAGGGTEEDKEAKERDRPPANMQRLIDAGLLPRGTRVFQGAGGQYRRDLHAQAEEHRCMLAYGLAKGNCYLSFRSKAEFVKVYHKLLLHLAEAPADGAFRLDDANFYEQMYLVRHQPPPRLSVPQI